MMLIVHSSEYLVLVLFPVLNELITFLVIKIKIKMNFLETFNWSNFDESIRSFLAQKNTMVNTSFF
jgi:hypothetical protein